jgi:hypothetical protein
LERWNGSEIDIWVWFDDESNTVEEACAVTTPWGKTVRRARELVWLDP